LRNFLISFFRQKVDPKIFVYFSRGEGVQPRTPSEYRPYHNSVLRMLIKQTKTETKWFIK